MRPKPAESTIAYAARLREQASQCEFEASNDDRILEHLIQTVSGQDSLQLIQKAIHKKWNLDQFLTEASQTEDISLEMKQMTEKTLATVHDSNTRQRRHGYRGKNPRSYPKCEYCTDLPVTRKAKTVLHTAKYAANAKEETTSLPYVNQQCQAPNPHQDIRKPSDESRKQQRRNRQVMIQPALTMTSFSRR